MCACILIIYNEFMVWAKIWTRLLFSYSHVLLCYAIANDDVVLNESLTAIYIN